MAKLNRIDRLLGVLLLLQSKTYVTVGELTERFGISSRTVYRDIRALEEQGVPVGFEPQQGYFIVDGYFLPPVSFSIEEARALVLTEWVVQVFTDRSIREQFSSALQKVKAVLPENEKTDLETLTERMGMQVPDCAKQEYNLLVPIENALVKKERFEMTYCNQKEEVSSRMVDPIGLIYYAFNWHLIAWCHLRQDYRDFRVSRIREVRLTGENFEEHSQISIAELMQKLPVEW